MKPERKNSMAPVNISRRRLTLAASASLATPAGLTAQEATRGNILFICVDDMDYGLFQHMAQVRRLVGAPGMECENHFISLTLCCPSRATMLRGQFGHNTDIVANGGKFGGFNKFFQDGLESSTIATWLQRSGYRTGLVGKYLNDYPSEASGKTYVPPGWDTWFVPNGGDEYGQYNYDVNDDGRTVHFGSRPQDHFNDVMLQRAQAFIRDAAGDPPGRPFFLYVAPFLPHTPFTAPPRYLSLLPDVKAPRPPSFNEADVSDKPVWVQRLPRLDAEAIRAIDLMYRKRRQCTQALDDMVAALVSTLRSTGQLANTTVVFTSDNGFFHGEHRIPDDKRRAFEEAIRAPLLMRGPGIPAGRVVRELTANVDFAPTFAAIAGVATPPSWTAAPWCRCSAARRRPAGASRCCWRASRRRSTARACPTADCAPPSARASCSTTAARASTTTCGWTPTSCRTATTACASRSKGRWRSRYRRSRTRAARHCAARRRCRPARAEARIQSRHRFLPRLDGARQRRKFPLPCRHCASGLGTWKGAP